MDTLEYMALSSLSYQDLNGYGGMSLQEIIQDEAIRGVRYDSLNNLQISDNELAALSSMQNWTLLDFDSNPTSGFAAAAFQAPPGPNNEPGEVVFSFAGTDPSTIADLKTDATLAMKDLPGQFLDAIQFVKDTLITHPSVGTNYSFTSHSLGGSIAQYMTYYSKVERPSGSVDIPAVIFDAPGIGRLDDLVTANPSGFNSLITNYINENDYIGGFGIHLGVTKYLKDTTPGYSSMNQAQRKALREYVSIALLISTGGISELVGEKLLLNKGAEFTALIFSEGRETGVNSIAGGAGNDWIEGGDSHDVLFGDAGNDTIHGMAGGDWIDGGDILYFFVGRLSCIKKELMYGL